LRASYRAPNGTTVTYVYGTDAALVRDSLGNYHLDVTTSADGTHKVRFVGTGTGASANEVAFFTRSDFV
jgi:hypothetical protein